MPVGFRVVFFVLFCSLFWAVVFFAKGKVMEQSERNALTKKDIKQPNAISSTTTTIPYEPKTNWKGYPE